MGEALMRSKRYLVLGVLLALLCITGCDLKSVVLVIPDFESAQVQGAFFYRENPANGAFLRETEIRFGSTYFESGEERVDYTTTNQGWADLDLTARVERNGNNVLLRINWGAEGSPGSYRASTYNVAGESALSGAVAL